MAPEVKDRMRPGRTLWRRTRERTLVAAVTVGGFLLCLLLLGTDVLHPLELATVDARFAARGDDPGRAARALVVGIDSESFRELNATFPLPRHFYGDAVERLRQEGARAVAIDVQFTEKSTPREDNALISSLRRAPGTMLVTTEVGGRGSTQVLGGPDAQRYARVRVASGQFPVESGGTYRRFNLAEGGLPTLPVLAGSVRRADALGRPPVWIDYTGGTGTVETVSLAALLQGRVPASLVRGRTVVLGATAPTLQDIHNYSALSSAQMTGAEVEANAILTAADGAPLREVTGWLSTLLTLALVLPIPALVVGRRPRVAPAAVLGSAVVYIVVVQLAFDEGRILPAANPLIGLLIVGAASTVGSYIVELRARAELIRASRARALFAADEARRGVERDLHDGVQQRLLALAMMLGQPDARAEADTLGRAVGEVMTALDELRDLARGVYPTMLTEGGLGAALRSLTDSAALPVVLDADQLGTVVEPIQRAAYFIAAESLANAIKHAAASRVTIEARRNESTLTVSIADDGVGGANPDGSGLRGLAERAQACGGRLDIASEPGAGTTITAKLPLSG